MACLGMADAKEPFQVMCDIGKIVRETKKEFIIQLDREYCNRAYGATNFQFHEDIQHHLQPQD